MTASGGRILPAFLLAGLTLLTLGSPTSARDAACRIEQSGSVAVERTCEFVPDGRDGSFSLSAKGGGPLFGSVVTVTVSIVEPGVAEVRGLTRDGINSRWGMARRSVRDRACWQGADFVVCAR